MDLDEFEEASSDREEEVEPPPQQEYDQAPDRIVYRFRVFTDKVTFAKSFFYTLAAGTPLPHETVVKHKSSGCKFPITIAKNLLAIVNNYKTQIDPGTGVYLAFAREIADVNENEVLGVGRGDGGGGGLGQHSGLAQHGGPGGDGGLVRVPVNSIQGQDVFLNADTDDTLPNLNLNGLTVGNAITASAPTQPPEDSVKTNSHQKPDWLDNLTNNFESEIISECSKSTREAYQNNQSVFNPPSEWGNVRMEIKRMIVKKLKFIFNGSGRPVLPDVQKIVNVLKSGYPAFAETTKAGYKYGGSSGIDGFASQILTELYRTDGRSKARPRIKRKSGDDESAEEDESDDKLKPKKLRLVYGVDPKKFNAKKITNEASIAFKSLTNLNFEDREKIFSAHRSSLQAVLIQTPAAIPLTIPEFWSDSRHLESQFVYVTGSSEGLTKNIENRYASQIKIIEDVIKFKSEDGHVEEKIKEAEMKCAADYAGSELYKDIIVLRAASAQMGTTGKSESSFIRFWYEGEDNPEFSGPHLTAIYNGNMWGFELWVDKQPLIRNLDVVTAISAYLHLCFTLNLEYPAEVAFFMDILQRNLAYYGDMTGTRTGKKKATAQRKLNDYNECIKILNSIKK